MAKPAAALVKEDKPQPELHLFREFEHAMLDLERRMDRVVRDAFGDPPFPFPLLQGLALDRDAAGRLRLQPFGHLQDSLGKFLEGGREPVLTWSVDPDANTVVFRAEVRPDGLHVEGDSKSEGRSERYRADCKPGLALDTARAEARYRDGVLTVACSLAEPDGAKARKLAVR